MRRFHTTLVTLLIVACNADDVSTATSHRKIVTVTVKATFATLSSVPSTANVPSI